MNILEELPADIQPHIINNCSQPRAMEASKNMYSLFKPVMEVQELLHAVIWSDADDKVPRKFTTLLNAKPDLLFQKSHVIREGIKTLDGDSLYEQIYYDVSPFQLILFLGDLYLLEKVKPFINQENREHAVAQIAELQGGGADLVKLDIKFDDERIKDFGELTYRDLTQFVVTDENSSIANEVFPLLENKDGIIFYNQQFYYVSLNHAKQALEDVKLLTFKATTQQQRALDRFIKSFVDMEIGTTRYSTDQEHKLIQEVAETPSGIRLARHGIRFKRGENYYQNCKAESLLSKALRTYINLWNQAFYLWDTQKTLVEALKETEELTWPDVGVAQANDTADKLLLYCNPNLPFGAMSTNFKHQYLASLTAQRAFNIHLSHRHLSTTTLYTKSSDLLGINYALDKSGFGKSLACKRHFGGPSINAALDLLTIHAYEKRSRAEINEYILLLEGSLPSLSK